jgi:hypothetical protein
MSVIAEAVQHGLHDRHAVSSTLIWKVGHLHKSKYLTMILPDLQGTFDQSDFFVYAACDRIYFNEFGPAFIRSIRANADCNIHIHIFNPDPDQIEFCQRHGVGVTWEHVHQTLFVPASQRWNTVPAQEPQRSQYDRTVNAMGKGGDASIIERMQKTYYACARFIRLAELYKNQTVFAVDIDAVVRRPWPVLDSSRDFYIHYISGKRARYLAGGLWLNPSESCQQFLHKYADQLRSYFVNDYIYWGLDQDLLDPVVPQFNHGQLPIEYIDWNMNANSYVWTAKGARKNLAVFVNEQQRYTA